jgi:hypothetical protein
MPLFSDDTLISGTGDTLHTIESSEISMESELLIIKKNKDTGWDINVEYTFRNEKKVLKVDVAFISENQHTKWDGTNDYNGNIGNMETIMNGEVLFAKKQTKDNMDYFIYKATFNNGINKINHKYSIIGEQIGDPYSEAIRYRLTTGNNWKGTINNIRIEVVFDSPQFIEEYNSLFSPEGEYKKGSYKEKYFNGKMKNYIYMKKGKLVFESKDYIAKEDLFIHIGGIPILVNEFTGEQKKISVQDLISKKLNQLQLKDLSKQQLRILRNTIFAIHQYKFETNDLREYFSNYGWYIADQENSMNLSDIEKYNIDLIRKEE